MATIAFDVYGTLIDTDGMVPQLREWIGSQAETFSKAWRSKQLEYSFRRGLMRQYENFAVCTRQALEYCCTDYEVSLSSEQKDELLQSYRSLPAFADVEESLGALKAEGHLLFAFSNGSAEAVEEVLQTNGLRQCFEDVVSCDVLKTFKPNPDVYHYFIREAGEAKDAWLVSGNPFDVIGAISAGMKSAWVKRTDRVVFDPWGIEPTLTVATLSELCEKLDINKPKGTYE
ncbi:haloacid dehalogenase type II [Verrucomicrobia bacterium]|nr:haloacid dehalogenase type II [Verrucomicrobiota bacterium]